MSDSPVTPEIYPLEAFIGHPYSTIYTMYDVPDEFTVRLIMANHNIDFDSLSYEEQQIALLTDTDEL